MPSIMPQLHVHARSPRDAEAQSKVRKLELEGEATGPPYRCHPISVNKGSVGRMSMLPNVDLAQVARRAISPGQQRVVRHIFFGDNFPQSGPARFRRGSTEKRRSLAQSKHTAQNGDVAGTKMDITVKCSDKRPLHLHRKLG